MWDVSMQRNILVANHDSQSRKKSYINHIFGKRYLTKGFINISKSESSY